MSDRDDTRAGAAGTPLEPRSSAHADRKQAPSLALSLVIPAYNERERLPPYLARVRSYLSQQTADDYEVIVVDDGSFDGLADVLQQLAHTWSRLVVIRHRQNRGKGAAVRTGMLAARGRLLLLADADGATCIEEESRLRAAIDAGADVAIGSRWGRAAGVVRRRSRSRAVVGRVFAIVASLALGRRACDTQCGFKMFRGAVAKQLFELVEEQHYLFDLELLLLAESLGCRVVEVPVNWSDVPGSHMSLARETWRVPAGLWRLRRRRATLKPTRDCRPLKQSKTG